MNAYRKDGRGWWLVTTRRLKSFKWFALGAVILNLLLFMSLLWTSTPRSSNPQGVPAGRLDNVDFAHDNEVQTDLSDRSKLKAALGNPGKSHKKPIGLEVTSNFALQNTESGLARTACSYRTIAYLNGRQIELNQSPFEDYLKGMTCLDSGDIAVFDGKFVMFNNVLVDSVKIVSARRGGEKMEDVWNQKEDEEYFKLAPGYFKASCLDTPALIFSHVDHLNEWSKVLECYRPNKTDLTLFQTVHGTTLAIQRYEYVNLYHTVTDFYNAFVLALIFGVPPSKLNILAVDAHPEGTLDPVWLVLFGNFIRAGRLPQPTLFENLVWGMLGYFSPLNEHERSSVPYLEEFREYFLSRHNISLGHVINCAKLNVLIIWRRDYVAHPRNPKGSVVRKFENENEMVQEVKDTLGNGASVQGLQLDMMDMDEQLEAVAKTDILVGMHGAGLSHILFLPATSGVIEFKPEYSNPALQHFKAMSYWRHVPYTIWHNYDLANERADQKTYIPRSIMRKTITDIYSQICEAGRS